MAYAAVILVIFLHRYGVPHLLPSAVFGVAEATKDFKLTRFHFTQ